MDCLMRHLPKRGGWFLEAGGVDGFFESNTYELERFCSYTGCIVEPNLDMFSRIRINRPSAVAIRAALVEDETLIQAGRMIESHAISRFEPIKIKNDSSVPTRSLKSILDEINPPRWDFLSLDIEGYELHALKGIDFDSASPDYILTEALNEHNEKELIHFLSKNYTLIEKPTHRDLLFKKHR